MAKEVTLKVTQEQADFFKSWLDQQVNKSKKETYQRGATMAQAREALRKDFTITSDKKTGEPLLDGQPAASEPQFKKLAQYLREKFSKINNEYIGGRTVMDAVREAAAANAIAAKTAERLKKRGLFK